MKDGNSFAARMAMLCAMLFGILLVFGCAARQKTATPENVLRLHVIANSDSEADQQVKLQVRDAVIAAIEPCTSAEQTRKYLLEHGAAILEAAQQTLKDNGFSYDAQLMLGRFEFPDRQYGDMLYPAGEYEALRVVLGEGAGQNWWCVLFPPLCIVTKDSEPLPDGEDLVFHSSILDWIRSWRENG